MMGVWAEESPRGLISLRGSTWPGGEVPGAAFAGGSRSGVRTGKGSGGSSLCHTGSWGGGDLGLWG